MEKGKFSLQAIIIILVCKVVAASLRITDLLIFNISFHYIKNHIF